jgi:hypothetical protein
LRQFIPLNKPILPNTENIHQCSQEKAALAGSLKATKVAARARVFYYTYGFNVSGAQEGVHYFTGKLETPKESLGQSRADKDGFIAKAAGDIIAKNKPDVWSVDESRKIENVQNGLE